MNSNSRTSYLLFLIFLLNSLQIATASSKHYSQYSKHFNVEEMKNIANRQIPQLQTLIQFSKGEPQHCISSPCPDKCTPCLRGIYSFFETKTIPQLSQQRLIQIIETKKEQIAAERLSEGHLDHDYLCQSIKRQIQILLLQNSQLKNSQRNLKKTNQNTAQNLSQKDTKLQECLGQLQICQQKNCPICPSIDCPECPLTQINNLSACQAEINALKTTLQSNKTQRINLNTKISQYEYEIYIWKQFLHEIISQVRQEIDNKTNSQNKTNINFSKLDSSLKRIQKVLVSSNLTFKEQSKQYHTLINSFSQQLVNFIDEVAALSTQATLEKKELLKHFKEAVQSLKKCNQNLKGKK